MDYIQRMFELRSIIRNCAIKPPEALSHRREGLHVYMRRRHDATRVLRPRISIKTSNFIFKSTGTAVAPIVHVPCHRRARLPSSGVPCRFSTVLLLLLSLPVCSLRVIEGAPLDSLVGKPIAVETRVSTCWRDYRVLFSRRDRSLYPKGLATSRRYV